MDYYEILGVSKNASEEDIKKAFKQKAFQWHPDRCKESNAEEMFKTINEAYQTLSDKNKRIAYDHGGEESIFSNGFGFGDMPNDFQDFFGHYFSEMFGRQRNNVNKTKPIQSQIIVELNIKDVLRGKQIDIEQDLNFYCIPCHGSGFECDSHGYPKETDLKSCTTCNGRGSISKKTGMMLVTGPCTKCNGKGKTGIKQSCKICNNNPKITKKHKFKLEIPCGILQESMLEKEIVSDNQRAILNIHVKIINDSPYIIQSNGNLHGKLPLTFPQMCLGGNFPCTMVDGSEVIVKVFPNIGVDKTIKLKEKGLPRSINNLNNLGDLYLVTELKMPELLTEEQKELLQKLQNTFEIKN